MKLSIIVPVYNTEKYLDKCLNKILNSTLSDYELIVINDGTKDNSEDIILKYQEMFNEKMIYIKKENTGLSDTRNIGIKKAQGEYIAFLDSDDYIEPDMYEKMLRKAYESSYDMVVCDILYVYENSNKTKYVGSGIEKDVINKDNIKSIYKSYYPAVWNKIYKKNLLEDIEFTKGVWFEDMEFMLKLLPKVNSIGVVKEALYNYVQRDGSITYTFNEKLYDIIYNMDRVLDYYKINKIYNEYYSELEFLYIRYLFATFIKRLAKIKDYKKYMAGVNFAMDKVKENFPNYKVNKYLNQVGIKGIYLKHFNKFFAIINYLIQKL